MNTDRSCLQSQQARAWLPQLLFMLCLALWAATGHAQADPPGRVGRLADLRGAVSWWDDETGRWAEAGRNQPLTGGDRVSTAAGGSAELRVGSTVLRLGANTDVEVLRLDDEGLAFQLHSGHLALSVRSREIAEEIELVTAEARYVPLGAGHFRLDRTDDTTLATSWRGDLRIVDPAGFVLSAGQRVELFRDRRSAALRFQIGVPVNDGFADGVQRADQRDERSVSARYVSPEMTGVEDLDRDGRWEQHPEFGAVWLPQTVAADWAPYSDGRWTWVQPWGWTWVDNARWGFAPFHYGRWAYWRNSWCWVPGAYVARPVYAPALVAWVGGGGWGVRLNLGGPSVGWLPLAPREAYAPHYAVTPRYRERINPAPAYRWQHEPGRPPGGPVVYGNQGVPRAVTVVPRETLVHGEPVRRGDSDGRDGRGRRDDRPPEVRQPELRPPEVHQPDSRSPDTRPPGRGPWGRDGSPPNPTTRTPPTPLPAAVLPQPQPQQFGPPAPRAQPQPQSAPPPQPRPQPAPQPSAAQPAPPATPPVVVVTKPAVERPRNADRDRVRERERRPAGGDGARPNKDGENQK